MFLKGGKKGTQDEYNQRSSISKAKSVKYKPLNETRKVPSRVTSFDKATLDFISSSNDKPLNYL